MARVSIADVAARIHYDMVTDPRNGYSQGSRWGGQTGQSKTLAINGRSYTYPVGDYDCSSSVITAWRLALKGTPYEGRLGGATYTGDMRSAFVGSGLFTASLTPAKRGDLYLAEGKHTAMCQDGGGDGVFGYDCLSEFNRNENHAATGGKVGDQDGYESVFRGYYDDGWNTVLHYNGKADYDAAPRVPKVNGAMYRLFGGANDHFLTTNHGEAESLANGGWSYEGVAWVVPSGGADVWRLYDPKGEHLLTANAAERDALTKAGWRLEGVACKSGGSVPIYRVYDPKAGRHLLTANRGERDALLRSGWRDEGVALHAER